MGNNECKQSCMPRPKQNNECLFLVTLVIYQGQILKIFVRESIFLGHPFTHSLSQSINIY